MDSKNQPWESVPFKHPSQESRNHRRSRGLCQRQRVLSEYWKRRYLLYGPLGTGKSSMIAAMANHLGYDVYDLELTNVHTNGEMRKLLIKTTNKSIIVIEDIDCSLNLSSRAKKPAARVNSVMAGSPMQRPDENNNSVTLSGLLNFTDRLWSCCRSERIFVFTTNHVEKLDPALLRSGRMDMHIFMSFCIFPTLKILVKNYLGIEKQQLFPELEQVTEDAWMTPADVSEILVKYRLNATRALEELLETFKAAKDKPHASWAREEKPNPNPVEDEQQEKRALETPKKTQIHEDYLMSADRCQCQRNQQKENAIGKDKDAENQGKKNDQSGEQEGTDDSKMQKAE